MNPEQYFNSVADEYNKNRSRGIHGYFAKNEMIMAIKLLDIKKEDRVLDAGCGSGLYSLIIKDKGAKPYGIDVSKKMIVNLKKNKIN